jgi:hypothetical protein
MVANVATPAGSGFGMNFPGSGPVLDLTVFAAAGTTSAVLGVPFYYGSRPTSGAWCTMPRVNQNVAGAWPSNQEALDFALHDLNAEQRQAKIDELHKAAEEQAKAYAEAEEKAKNAFHESASAASIPAHGNEEEHARGRAAPRRR